MQSHSYDPDTGEILHVPQMQMRTCSETNELYAALAKAQAELENVEKTGSNPHFRSRYATLGGVLDEVRPKFSKHGIAIIQMPVNEGADIGVVTRFGHSSGQWIESLFHVPPAKFDAQSAGSVVTYLRRYALMAMAGVGADDDDGNAAVGRPTQQTAQEQVRIVRQQPPQTQVTALTNGSAPPASADEKAELRNEIKMMREAIDEADETGLNLILDSKDMLGLCTRLREVLGKPQGDVQVNQLISRIEKRKKSFEMQEYEV